MEARPGFGFPEPDKGGHDQNPTRFNTGYIDGKYDLTDRMIEITTNTYNQEAPTYRKMMEKDPESIRIVLEKVIGSPLILKKILSLDRGDRILVAGCSTFITALMLAVIRPADVYAFDLSPRMLEEGRLNLEWDQVSELWEQVKPFMMQLQDENGEHIETWLESTQNLMIALEEVGDLDDIAEKAQERIMSSIRRRIKPFQGNLEDKFFADGSFDLPIDNAVLQQVPKEHLPAAISHTISMMKGPVYNENGRLIKTGAAFYLDLRIDPTGSPQGRVYHDKLLNGQSRFINTYSKAEINSLKEYLLLDHPNIRIVETDNDSVPPQEGKPAFWCAAIEIVQPDIEEVV